MFAALSPFEEQETAMFRAEAEWLQNLLRLQSREALSPMLNIGSSTQTFREQQQPWTERCIFGPLKDRGVGVLHLDNREGEGIDIRADILNPAELPRLKALGRQRTPLPGLA